MSLLHATAILSRILFGGKRKEPNFLGPELPLGETILCFLFYFFSLSQFDIHYLGQRGRWGVWKDVFGDSKQVKCFYDCGRWR